MKEFSDTNIQRAYDLGIKTEKKNVQIKLLKRAAHLLGNITDPNSPMILVATELKIQADEIKSTQFTRGTQ